MSLDLKHPETCRQIRGYDDHDWGLGEIPSSAFGDTGKADRRLINELYQLPGGDYYLG
jgi:hypothetical protein